MTWDQVRGGWKQFKGELERRWATLTDDDVLLLKGTRDVFMGKLQQRTGSAREGAERQLEALIARVESNKKSQGVICLPAA